MRRKISLFLLILSVLSPMKEVGATEVSSVETQGTIGFTGVYKPIGIPDPVPPEIIVRPPTNDNTMTDGSLPQTNELRSRWQSIVGGNILFLVLFLWLKKKQKK